MTSKTFSSPKTFDNIFLICKDGSVISILDEVNLCDDKTYTLSIDHPSHYAVTSLGLQYDGQTVYTSLYADEYETS